jgi:hypothetical protein
VSLQQIVQPVSGPGRGFAADPVADRIPPSGGRGAGFACQVVPGAVQQLARDHRVVVTLCNEDRDPGRSSGGGRDPGVEGQCAREDRRAGEAGRLVEEQPAGERGATAESDEDDRAPGRGDRASSQSRNQSIVDLSDCGSGRPIPRFANQAYPPPSAIGARTAA